MNEISQEFADHLAGTVTTVCHCWRLRREDGTVLGFTDHDRPLFVDGDRFEPQSGLSATEARQSLGLAADAMDVAGALTSDVVTDADIEAGLYDRATVETLLVNWADTGQHLVVTSAILGKITRGDGGFTAELISPMQALDQPNGRYFRRACDAELGDAGCGVDLSAPGFIASGTVGQVHAPNGFSAGGLVGFARDWFTLGWITWRTGALAGMRNRVVSHRIDDGSVRITFETDRCATIAIGDEFDIVAGCDKRFATCRTKFANHINFRGFPHLPGNDAAYAYASEGQTFDGGPLVP